MKRYLVICFFCLFSFVSYSQSGMLDEIIFGKVSSEKEHCFKERSSQIIVGGLNEPARLLLPIKGERVEGGNMTFRMKVSRTNRTISRHVFRVRTLVIATSLFCFVRASRLVIVI